MSAIAIVFTPDGTGRALYTEAIDLERIGELSISRASEVEFCNDSGLWTVRLPGEPYVLYKHPSRQACLNWERQHLETQEDKRHELQHSADPVPARA